jgi:hypothetical protein
MCRLMWSVVAGVAVIAAGARPASAPQHPYLLFNTSELTAIRARASHPTLAPVAARLVSRADALLKAAPLLVSTTGRGEADPPGQIKGLEAARRLQGRVLTYAMTFLLKGDRRYRDAAVAELDHAIVQWPIWVDTAHPPPYDLMAGEISLTFGLAWDDGPVSRRDHALEADVVVHGRPQLEPGLQRRRRGAGAGARLRERAFGGGAPHGGARNERLLESPGR